MPAEVLLLGEKKGRPHWCSKKDYPRQRKPLLRQSTEDTYPQRRRSACFHFPTQGRQEAIQTIF
jgi:hypothetical protein